MLCTGRDVVWSHMVRVITLHTFDLSHSHLRIDIGILAEAFPHAWPFRIAAKIHCWREGPRDVCRTALVRCHLTHVVCVVTVECSCDIDFLRKECSACHICHSVYVVKSVECRDSACLDGDAVDLCNELIITLRGLSYVTRSIEHRTYLIVSERYFSCFCDLDAICNGCCVELGHLTSLFLECHAFEHFLDLCLDVLVLRNCRLD